MDRSRDSALTFLQRHALLTLEPGLGRGVVVLSGEVWITEPGLLDDAVLGAGGNLRLTSRGLVVIEALEPSTLVVVDTLAARPAAVPRTDPIAPARPSREQVEREARALRRAAVAQAWRWVATSLDGAWRAVQRRLPRPSAASRGTSRSPAPPAARRAERSRSLRPYRQPYHAPLTARGG